MSDEIDHRDLIIIVILVLLFSLAMTSCTTRLSPGQAQALADARAGAMAAQQKRDAIAHAQDPVQANLEAQAQLDDLYRGLIGFTLATTANIDLPAPAFQPTVLIEDPDRALAYGEKGVAASKKPPKGWGAGVWTLVGSTALGAIGLALKLGRNVPGVGGVVSGMLSLAWDHFASDKVKEQEEAVDAGLDAAILYAERAAEIARAAGFGAMVDDAKERTRFLAITTGAQDEIKRRLALARSGALRLPALPADQLVTRPAQMPVKPSAPEAG